MSEFLKLSSPVSKVSWSFKAEDTGGTAPYTDQIDQIYSRELSFSWKEENEIESGHSEGKRIK